MDFKSSLRGGLFIFECFRFTFLMGVMIAVWRSNPEISFPWLIYLVPNALFLLMTLFLWLNFNQYRVYVPLYISGKVLSLFSILGLFIFSPQAAFDMFLSKSGLNSNFVILFFGDLLTIFNAIFITKNLKPWGKRIVENTINHDKIDNTDEGAQ